MYTQSLQATVGGPNSSNGDVLLSILEFLHCHKKLLVDVGDGYIDKARILSQKLLLSIGEKLAARTLHRMAKKILCN